MLCFDGSEPRTTRLQQGQRTSHRVVPHLADLRVNVIEFVDLGNNPGLVAVQRNQDEILDLCGMETNRQRLAFLLLLLSSVSTYGFCCCGT